MELSNIVAAAVAFFAGLAADWMRGIGAGVLSNREIRSAVRVEIERVLVTLNFYLMKATEPNADAASTLQYPGQFPRLESVEYYWENDRKRFLRLPEWTLLRGWADRLGKIGTGSHPALFDVIMLFESLTAKPLKHCLGRESRKFVQRILARREIDIYKMDYMLRWSGLEK